MVYLLVFAVPGCDVADDHDDDDENDENETARHCAAAAAKLCGWLCCLGYFGSWERFRGDQQNRMLTAPLSSRSHLSRALFVSCL